MSSSQTTGGGGIDAKTLAITAAASAGAAYVTSQVWAPGTLGAAATFPVLIALLKETLARPKEVVTRVVPVRGVVRSASPDGEAEPAGPSEPPVERVPQAGEIPGRSRPVAGHAWKMAFVTGLLGFVIAAVIITVPEFVAGKSASGDRQTTLFGGERSSERDDETETDTETEPTQTRGVPPAATVTVPPAQTTTVPPPTTTVPPGRTPTVPPQQEEGEEGEFPPAPR